LKLIGGVRNGRREERIGLITKRSKRMTKATKTDYARKCQQLDVLIDLLERENKRLRELIEEQERKNEKDDTGKAS
jgi:cell shape-determining protein MreC